MGEAMLVIKFLAFLGALLAVITLIGITIMEQIYRRVQEKLGHHQPIETMKNA